MALKKDSKLTADEMVARLSYLRKDQAQLKKSLRAEMDARRECECRCNRLGRALILLQQGLATAIADYDAAKGTGL